MPSKYFAPRLEAKSGATLSNHIYMDALGFGPGCCCLQVTLQAATIEEARHVYDALVPVTPMMVKQSYDLIMNGCILTDLGF
jgi:hypothetical protein